MVHSFSCGTKRAFWLQKLDLICLTALQYCKSCLKKVDELEQGWDAMHWHCNSLQCTAILHQSNDCKHCNDGYTSLQSLEWSKAVIEIIANHWQFISMDSALIRSSVPTFISVESRLRHAGSYEENMCSGVDDSAAWRTERDYNQWSWNFTISHVPRTSVSELIPVP